MRRTASASCTGVMPNAVRVSFTHLSTSGLLCPRTITSTGKPTLGEYAPASSQLPKCPLTRITPLPASYWRRTGVKSSVLSNSP